MSERAETIEQHRPDRKRRFAREVLIPAEQEVEDTDDIPEGIIRQIEGARPARHDDRREIRRARPVALRGRQSSGGARPTPRRSIAPISAPATAPARRHHRRRHREQRQRHSPRIARGADAGLLRLTEPDAGSDAASLTTRAVRDGDHYVIDGTKRCTTTSPHAGLSSPCSPAPRPGAGVAASRPSWSKLGRARPGPSPSPTRRWLPRRPHRRRDLRELPRAGVLAARRPRGHRLHLGDEVARDHAVHMAAVAVGMCERLLDEGVSYATERRQVQLGRSRSFSRCRACWPTAPPKRWPHARWSRPSPATTSTAGASPSSRPAASTPPPRRSAGRDRVLADPRRPRLHQGVSR